MNKTISYITAQALLLIALLFAVSKANSQQLIGLSQNPQLAKSRVEVVGLKNAKTLTLPFFEDFSSYHGEFLPRADKWLDQQAFINTSFPDSCISIGVATLDAIDAYGNVYALTNRLTPSDTLTSQPIDLFAAKGQGLYFAFFYQGGGKGDAPEAMDSLFLDFYQPSTGMWVTAWTKSGEQMHTFRQVVIEIIDSLKESQFQFRFRNFTSMSPDEVIGRRGALSNVDQWHIDYIEIKPADNIQEMAQLNDMMFIEPLMSPLINYESMPFDHLAAAGDYGFTNVNPIVIRTTYEETAIIETGRVHILDDILLDTNLLTEPDTSAGLINSIDGNAITSFTDDFNSGGRLRSDPQLEYWQFKTKSYIINKTAGLSNKLENDTAIRIDTYTDYYAYDDGIPEFGFGISGESAYGSKLAYRFMPSISIEKQSDTLTDIDIYFNKTRNDYTSSLSFAIAVWDNKGSKPDKLLYASSTLYSPVFEDNEVGFIRYPIDSLIIVSNQEPIYVGMIQYTDDFINIGYDVNRDTRDQMFIQTESEWYNPYSSISAGSLMIRAVFGKSHYQPPKTEKPVTDVSLQLYPNPATEYISLNQTINEQGNRAVYTIYDLSGRVVKQGHYEGIPIPVANLQPGTYMLRLDNPETHRMQHASFVKGL